MIPLAVLILMNAGCHKASVRLEDGVIDPTPERSISLKFPSALCAYVASSVPVSVVL
ncbi:hypothetical protein D3C85_1901370 [compost metagenome]